MVHWVYLSFSVGWEFSSNLTMKSRCKNGFMWKYLKLNTFLWNFLNQEFFEIRNGVKLYKSLRHLLQFGLIVLIFITHSAQSKSRLTQSLQLVCSGFTVELRILNYEAIAKLRISLGIKIRTDVLSVRLKFKNVLDDCDSQDQLLFTTFIRYKEPSKMLVLPKQA